MIGRELKGIKSKLSTLDSLTDVVLAIFSSKTLAVGVFVGACYYIAGYGAIRRPFGLILLHRCNTLTSLNFQTTCMALPFNQWYGAPNHQS